MTIFVTLEANELCTDCEAAGSSAAFCKSRGCFVPADWYPSGGKTPSDCNKVGTTDGMGSKKELATDEVAADRVTADLAVCGVRLHIHTEGVNAWGDDKTADDRLQKGCEGNVVGGHWNTAPGVRTSPKCAAASSSVDKFKDCEDGDLTGKFGMFDIGVKGKPTKYFLVDTVLSLEASVTQDNGIHQKAVVMHSTTATPVSDRVVCTEISDPHNWNVKELRDNDEGR
jgi:hypothetical protein